MQLALGSKQHKLPCFPSSRWSFGLKQLDTTLGFVGSCQNLTLHR